MGNNDTVEQGKEYMIFASTQKISDTKSMYCVLNVDQGQFEVINDKVTNKAIKYKENISKFEQDLQS